MSWLSEQGAELGGKLLVEAAEQLASFLWHTIAGDHPDAKEAVAEMAKRARDAALEALQLEAARQAVQRDLAEGLANVVIAANGVLDAFTPKGEIPPLGLTFDTSDTTPEGDP